MYSAGAAGAGAGGLLSGHGGREHCATGGAVDRDREADGSPRGHDADGGAADGGGAHLRLAFTRPPEQLAAAIATLGEIRP